MTIVTLSVLIRARSICSDLPPSCSALRHRHPTNWHKSDSFRAATYSAVTFDITAIHISHWHPSAAGCSLPLDISTFPPISVLSSKELLHTSLCERSIIYGSRYFPISESPFSYVNDPSIVWHSHYVTCPWPLTLLPFYFFLLLMTSYGALFFSVMVRI